MTARTEQELLWGYRPLGLLASAWACVVLLVGAIKPSNQRWRWLGLSSLSGLCLGLGFPPSPLIPFVFIGFIPLLLLEHELSASTDKNGFRVLGYAFNAFLIWNITSTWWVLNTSFMPGIVANVLNSFFMALVFVAFHKAKNVLGSRLHWLILAAFWIAFEWWHMQWELSWPWLTLGNSFAQFPSWIQWYDITGVFGGSLWVLAVNGLLFQVYLSKQTSGGWERRALVGMAALVVAPILLGSYQYFSYDLPEGDTEIAIIQPNYEPHYSKFNTSQRQQLQQFIRLSDSILTPTTEYLVFPETSFGLIELTDFERDYRIVALRDLLKRHPQVKLVTGIASTRRFPEYIDMPSIRSYVDRVGDTIYWDLQNSAVQLEVDHEVDVYFKSKLVPGAEIFPFRTTLPFLEPIVKMLDGTAAGHTTQDERDVFISGSVGVAPVICYESIYGAYVGEYLRKGADMLFIVTNDGWWDNTPGHIQHLKLGAVRAIEHRRPIARSANTGISCFINERGDIVQPTQYAETTAIVGKLNSTPRVVTFYTRWGDVIARLSLALSGLFIILSIVRTLTPAAKQ